MSPWKTLKGYLHRNSRIWLFCYLPVFLLLFLVAERLNPADGVYWCTSCQVDAAIPFVAWYAVFYCCWYPLLAGLAVYTCLREPGAFVRFGCFVAVGFTACLAICILAPNGQDLRPAALPEGLFGRVVAGIYRADTNTNVFPSVHVVGTVAAVLAVFDSPSLRRLRLPAAELGVLIIMSTLFIKQHSVLDVLGAFLLCLPLGLGVYARRLRAAMGPRPADTAASS